MRWFTRLTLILCLLAAIPQVMAAGQSHRPKIGLVLGGGGAAGVAHVGVLKVLEEQGIPIDVIAGTSMGAIVGSLYASGYRADELEQVVKSLDWIDLFQDGQNRAQQSFQQKRENAGFFNTFELGIKDKALKLPEGLVSGQKLIFELRRLLDRASQVEDFDRLPIPFRAVATDIETGEPVILRRGNLATAVRASMSIPGLFSPVTIGNHVLVDGFVSNNVPVDVARQMGADIVIVVNIPYYFETRDKLNSALAVSFQAMQFLTAKNSLPQLKGLKAPNVLIEPDLKEIGSLAFDKVEQTIPIGEQAARDKLAALAYLAKLAPAKGQGDTATNTNTNPTPEQKQIVKLSLKNESGLSNEVILSKLGIHAGEQLDLQALRRGLENIHSLGYFDLVDYELQPASNDQVELTVIARQRSTGDNRLRFGFSLEDNFSGDTQYQLGVRHVAKGISSTGGEWQNSAVIGNTIHLESKLHQPLDAEQSTFAEGSLWHNRSDVFAFSGNERTAELRLAETGIQADWGKNLGQDRELRAGVFYRHISPSLKTGQIDFPDNTYEATGTQLTYRVDTLDNADFPGRGQWFNANYTHGFKVLGADMTFDRLTANAGTAWTVGKHRILLKGEAGSTFANDTQITEQPTLGGIGRLSGLERDQLRGNYTAVGSGTYMYELTDFPGVAKVYAGGSLELGNAWQKRTDIQWGNLLMSGSLFVGLDSPIGPAFVGLGQTEGYESRLFMQVGRRF